MKFWYESLTHPLSNTDRLALERNRLANERTWLAWNRTALSLFVAGVSLIKFLGERWIEAIGWLLLPLSVLTLATGYLRYTRVRKACDAAERDT